MCVFTSSVSVCWVSMEQEKPPRFVCSPVTLEYPVEMPTSILTGEEINGIYSGVYDFNVYLVFGRIWVQSVRPLATALRMMLSLSHSLAGNT